MLASVLSGASTANVMTRPLEVLASAAACALSLPPGRARLWAPRAGGMVGAASFGPGPHTSAVLSDVGPAV